MVDGKPRTSEKWKEKGDEEALGEARVIVRWGGKRTTEAGSFAWIKVGRIVFDKTVTTWVSSKSDVSWPAQRMKERVMKDEKGRCLRQALRFCYAAGSGLSGRTEGLG